MSEDSKQNAWLEHYQRLLIVEFDWDPYHLYYQPPVEGPHIPPTIDMVKKAISQMKAGKALSPSGIVVEMIQVAGDMGASMICDLTAAIIHDGKIPSDWEQSFIVCLYKGKRDALDLRYGPGPLGRVQMSFHASSVALEWAATASSAMAASTGCTKNAVGSNA